MAALKVYSQPNNVPTLDPVVRSSPFGVQKKVPIAPKLNPAPLPPVQTRPAGVQASVPIAPRPVLPARLPVTTADGQPISTGQAPVPQTQLSASMLPEDRKTELVSLIERMKERNLSAEQITAVTRKYVADNAVAPEAPVEPIEPEVGGFQGFAQAVARPFLRAGTTAFRFKEGLNAAGKAFGNKIIGNEEGYQQRLGEANQLLDEDLPMDFGYFGKIKPIAFDSDKDSTVGEKARSVLDVAGVGAELASYGIGPVKGGQAVLKSLRQPATSALKRVGIGALKGAGYGAGGGAVGAFGAELQNPEATLGSVAGSTAIGAGLGLGIGGVIGGAVPAVGSLAKEANMLRKFPREVRVVNKNIAALGEIENNASALRKITSQAESRGFDIKKALVESDLLLNSVDETGTVRTEEAIARLNETIKPAEDVIAQNLRVEGRKVNLREVERALLNSIDDSGLQSGAKVRARKNAYDDIEGLLLSADKNGDIPVATIHSAKVDKYANINYLIPETKRADKAIAKAFKEIVERNTDSIDVKAINQELTDFYTLQNYLEKLNGKKVQGGKLGKYFAQTVGSIAGSHFGPIGTVVGSVIGSKVRGIQLASTFSKGIGGGLEHSPAMIRAIERGKLPTPRPAPLLQLPAPRIGAPDVSINTPINLPSKIFTNSADETVQGLKRVGGTSSRRANRIVETGKNLGKQRLYAGAPGTVAGFEKDEEGNLKFDPKKGALGFAVGSLATSKVARNLADDILSKVRTGSSDEVRVGLSGVKGRIGQVLDKLADEAETKFKAGNFEEAKALYDRITKESSQIIQKRFKGAGIRIKMQGTGFGVYKGTPEPNIDFSAIVPAGKEDLFHKILADIADKDFVQDSFLTYKPIESTLAKSGDLVYGITDKAKGISLEPYLSIKVEKPLNLSDIAKVNEALEKAGLEAMSIKEGGSTIDILNLTSYNKDYDKFITQTKEFRKNLDSQGVRGEAKFGVSESRFIGSDTSGATTTYERNQRDFYKGNKAFVKTGEENSKVLEAIQYKDSISKKELASIVNSNEISPTEKAVFQEVLDTIKDEKIAPSKVQGLLRAKLLTLKPEYSDSYVNYGWENVFHYDTGEPAALVFDTNFKHGQGQSHYAKEGIFGHSRYTIKEIDGKQVAHIGEVQSDVFQHGSNVEKATTDSRPIKELRETIKTRQEQLAEIDPIQTERQDYLKSIIAESEKEIAKLEAQNAKTTLPTQFGNFARKDKYRDRLLEETINELTKNKKVDEIRIASPSTVAKIEGYLGGDEYNSPYMITSSRDGAEIGRDIDLVPGDTIDYYDGEMTVVGVESQGRGWGGPPPTEIVVASSDKVNHYSSLNDIIDESARSRFDEEVVYNLKDELKKGLTPKRARKLLDDADTQGGWLDSGEQEALIEIADGEKTYTKDNIDELWDGELRDSFIESENDLYSSDKGSMFGVPDENVFFIDKGRGYDYEVYVVDEGTTPERLGQPSSFTKSFDPEDLSKIDNGAPKELYNELTSGSQQGVLENYYKIRDEFLPKYEKASGSKAEYVIDDDGNGWFKIKPKVIKKTVF